MAILTGSNLAQSFGADDLFTDVDVRVDAKERVGLVAPNGAGKTTLLQIMAGLQESVRGEIVLRRELSLAYLQQEAVLTFRGQRNTVFEEMLTVFTDLREMEAAMREMESQMEAGDFSEALLSRYGTIQEQYETSGGFEYTTEIKLTLLGLGFSESEWAMPLAHLSGGQKTRVLLARLLLEEPQLLILDEPTNHLDLNAVEWLEGRLRRWEGALIVVSHDRFFLDRVVGTIWELTPTQVKVYRGNYTEFVVRREQERERAATLFATERARMEKELVFIRKHVADGQSDMAKGKLRRLTRDIVLVEKFPVTEIEGKSWLEIGGRVRTFSANEAAQRLRKLRPVSTEPPVMRLRLDATETPDKTLFRGRGLTFGYGDVGLVSAETLRIERNQRIAILGENGSGKTTVLKAILRIVTNDFKQVSEQPKLVTGDDTVAVGDGLEPGYFAQAHDQLNPENRVIEQLMDAAPMGEQEARNRLARFLFRGHDVFKRIGDLSGGERGRLALAILATMRANFLLLDEPTNHLDLPSQEILQKELLAYDGTILLVSHDRYLVSKLATHIWDIRDGVLHVYEGGYAAFLERRALEEEGIDPDALESADESWIDAFSEMQQELAEEAEAENDRVDWKKRVGELEDLLDAAEAKVEELKLQIVTAGEFGSAELVTDLERSLIDAETELAILSDEWDQLME